MRGTPSMPDQYLEVHDSQAGGLFQKLESFLSPPRIDRMLKSVARELEIERGLYLQQWVQPNRNWWIGLREARAITKTGQSFRGRVTPRLRNTLESAAQISSLYGGMPPHKRIEFRERILGAKYLQPVLTEIQIASHFVQKGCRIAWSIDIAKSRIPEFIVKRGADEWEVECKTKGTDAGRRVARPSFYRLVDALGPVICNLGLQGTCQITLPNALPAQIRWRDEVVSTISDMIAKRDTDRRVSDGSSIRLSLEPQSGAVLTDEEANHIDASQGINHHVAIYGPIREGRRVDPIVIDVSSEKPDRYLEDVLADLREASRQFSGTRPALICCFVPEINSFAGLEKDSALKAMTIHFFEKHAPTFIHSVIYSSGRQIRLVGHNTYETFFPSLRFHNRRSTAHIPPDVLIAKLGTATE